MIKRLCTRSFMLMILLSFGWGTIAQEEPPDEPDDAEAVAPAPLSGLTTTLGTVPTPTPGAMQPFSLADSFLQAPPCPNHLANSPVVVSTFTQLDQAIACANASTTPYAIYLADQVGTFQFTHTLSIAGHVEIYGRGATLSVLDGGGANRLFSVGGQLLLSHVTLRNAKPPINYGGAMRNSGHLTLQDSVMTGNHARHGGGAILSTGTLTIERTHFLNNRAGGGAAIQMSGPATLSCVLFQGNTHHATQVRDYASALLAHNNGSATLRHSTFDNPTTDEISTQNSARVDARENYWSGRTVPTGVNQYGSQVTFGSELSQNPITTNPACAFRAPIAIPAPPAAYKYHVIDDGTKSWSGYERGSITTGVAQVGTAFNYLATTVSTPEDAFNLVMMENSGTEILFIRTDQPGLATVTITNYAYQHGTSKGQTGTFEYLEISQGYCKSFQEGLVGIVRRPAAVICNGDLIDQYDGTTRTLSASQYTVVHELGHLFDYRTGNALTNHLNLPLNDCNQGVILGQTQRGWERGRRGWGTGPAQYQSSFGPVRLITNFQQNSTNIPLEAAADLFLNWVYRLNNSGGVQPTNPCNANPRPTPGHWSGPGFLNAEWSATPHPSFVASSTGIPGTADPSLPGDIRYLDIYQLIGGLVP